MEELTNILNIDQNGYIVSSTDVDIENIVVEGIMNKSYENPDVDENTEFGQRVKTYTALIKQAQIGLISMANLQSIQHTPNLDYTARLKGHSRKTGYPTQTSITFHSLPNTTIPNGTIVSNESKDIQFITENDLVLDNNGNGSVMAFCSTVGAINPPLNSINTLITEIPNVDYISNESNAIVGADKENDTQFLQRILSVNQVDKNVIGTLDSIKRAILYLDNVIDVYAVENNSDEEKIIGTLTLDPHSISLVVNGGTLNEIAKAIKEKKNVGCGTTGNITASYVFTENGINYIDNYFIYRPSIVNFFLKITYSKNIKTPNNIESIIKQYILDWQQKNPFKLGTTIFATELIQAVNSIMYQFNIVNIQVKKFAEDNYNSFINMTEQEFAVLINSNIILESV